MCILSGKWCMKCNLKHLKHDFKKWSGNKRIDDLIQRIQTIANGPEKVMEWIPYENFKEVKYINRGGFATVYSADWSDGPIEKWDVKLKQWSRRKNEPVALKYVDNSKAEIDYFLKEVESYFEITDNSAFIRCLGISQHPDGRYIIVLEFAVLGSLRSYLDENHKHMTWKEKITALFNISMGLNTLHKSQLIHHDFHSGNLLFLRDVGGKFLNISDLGQCKRDGQNELKFVEQIKKAEKAEENSTDSPQINASKMPHYKTHPGAIYTSRLLDFSTLPPPVNAPDFEVSLKISSETENLHDSKIVNLDLSALEDTELQ
ncbi:16230_t:CDS:2, partial [Gigaspora margarita]